MKSLNASNHPISNTDHQIDILEESQKVSHIPHFDKRLQNIGLNPLKSTGFDIFQVNLGKMCNQTCAHCHVDAGPDRKEIMTRETMEHCLNILKSSDFSTVDLTGGAPELNPNFRWFVEKIKSIGKHVIVRCNLTIILANPRFNDLPDFFKKHQVEVVSSLPFYTKLRTDRQRGDGVFEKSIKALKMLNAVGYGSSESGLKLNLVFNPSGAFLPADQGQLEKDFKHLLLRDHGIEFNQLFAITNLPISRFLDYLLNSGNFETYMQKLSDAFNPMAAENVMCRNTLSIGWDGYIYDCDFNQMLNMKVDCHKSVHINDFNPEELNNRNIRTGNHCYGCTAGSGSSCGGTTT